MFLNVCKVVLLRIHKIYILFLVNICALYSYIVCMRSRHRNYYSLSIIFYLEKSLILLENR